MKKYYRIILYSTFSILFGVFMFIFGGYDDSPGAQLMGVIFFVVGIVALVKNKKV